MIPDATSMESVFAAMAARTTGSTQALGFRRVFLSSAEPQGGRVVLAAIAAKDGLHRRRVGIITTPARHPLHAAGLGATMQAALGHDSSSASAAQPGLARRLGLEMPGYKALRDYVDILRRYGPAKRFQLRRPGGDVPHLALEDVDPEVPPPPVWFGTLGQPLGAKTSAASSTASCCRPSSPPRRHARSWTACHDECRAIAATQRP